MDDKNRYVVIETGGSIGENSQRGHNRIAAGPFDNKEECKKRTKEYSSKYGGGYYNYHYSTKTVEWARKNCRSTELEGI